MKKIILYLSLIVLLVAGAVTGWAVYTVHKPLSLISAEILDLPQGSDTRALASHLEESGLFEHPLLVRLTVRYYGVGTHLKAGEYALAPGMSFKDLLDLVVSGKVILHKIRLPEGKTTTQLLEIISHEPLLTGDIPTNVQEGALMPETYKFHKGDKRAMIVKNAQKAMQEALERVWKSRQSNLPLQNKQELLILASIIEKETGRSDERAKVASVFINRLNRGMLLQTDPSVIYALTHGASDLGRSLKRKDLQIDSPYNTYKYVGLPPSPICNPSWASLKAAAHPQITSYLYFVADGTGGHNFSVTLKEHNDNVRKWLKKLRQKI